MDNEPGDKTMEKREPAVITRGKEGGSHEGEVEVRVGQDVVVARPVKNGVAMLVLNGNLVSMDTEAARALGRVWTPLLADPRQVALKVVTETLDSAKQLLDGGGIDDLTDEVFREACVVATARDVAEAYDLPPVGDEIAVKLDRKRVADLLVSAFEGGSNYWYMIEGYVEPEVLTPADPKLGVFKYADYPISKGGAVVISDATAATGKKIKKVTLDWNRVRWGLMRMLSKYPQHFADWLAEKDDANTADVFLQCCIFGDLVYG